MNKQDIDNLIRWSFDVELKRFSEEAYGVTGTAFDEYDDYLRGKFIQMQSNFIMWIAGLSDINRGRLNRAINKQKTLDDVLNKTKGE